jgi:hypothetical protein
MQEQKEIEQARKECKEYGRVNQKEYSDLTSKPSQVAKTQDDAKRFGRINVAEYKALNAKPQRKSSPRKRVAGK